MGVEHQDARAVLRLFNRHRINRGGRLLILGDAVIHFKYPHLRSMANELGVTIVQVDGDLTPYSLGTALGFDQVDTLDINGKATITADLQQELPPELLAGYDMVIDAGVLFWCFDPGLVLKNLLRLLKSGGLVFHITAVTGYFGRGYYNIHPSLLEDFYLANQCEFLQSSFRTKPRADWREMLWRSWGRLFGRDAAAEFGVEYIDMPGHTFLHKASRTRIRFERILSQPEALMIPNNVIGTFAFRKTSSGPLSEPVQKS